MNTELILADLQTVDNRLAKLGKEARMRPELRASLEAVTAARAVLDEGRTIASAAGEVDVSLLGDLHLLSAKPFLYVFNVDESELADPARRAELAALVAPAPSVVVCAQIEAEVATMDPADAADLLAGYGQERSGLVQLVHVGFEALGLQTFLTAGPKEARAWTIHIGDTAPEAAGVIHTDFQKGFIKAEIVRFDDLVAAGSLPAARRGGQGPHRGQGLRDARRRRRRVPLQHLSGCSAVLVGVGGQEGEGQVGQPDQGRGHPAGEHVDHGADGRGVLQGGLVEAD